MRTYRFHSDCSHGWLEVPIQDIFDLVIEAQVTSFSYMNGETAYLEEDQDMPTFIYALEKEDIEFQIVDLEQERYYSFIRDLDPLYL